ncbi:MAG: rhodanese-like domain-containing protein [Candidatus Margulisiibacteriota bacterium]
MVKSIFVEDLHEKMTNEEVCLLDVRGTDEFKASHVKGSLNIPMDVIEFHPHLFKNNVAYIICNSGGRSKMACQSLHQAGITNVINVEGGVMAWSKKQLPMVGQLKKSIPMMRQVMIVAGLMILSGVALHFLVNPKGIYLSAFVGAGLFYAGASGNCYMTKVLALFPWNK